MRVFCLLFAAGAAALACSTSSPTSGSASSTAGSTPADVDRCKRACEKMKFFQCSSAEELTACYGDCGSAGAAQIEVFTACAENSVCDPACRAKVKPDGKGSAGTGASPATCATACDKAIACSLLPVGKRNACVSQCTKAGYQYQIDCAVHAECENLVSACHLMESASSGTSGGGSAESGEL